MPTVERFGFSQILTWLLLMAVVLEPEDGAENSDVEDGKKTAVEKEELGSAQKKWRKVGSKVEPVAEALPGKIDILVHNCSADLVAHSDLRMLTGQRRLS